MLKPLAWFMSNKYPANRAILWGKMGRTVISVSRMVKTAALTGVKKKKLPLKGSLAGRPISLPEILRGG
ncbi:MAG: hypothetical protein ACTHMM_13865 [Agriterribacter sp.]